MIASTFFTIVGFLFFCGGMLAGLTSGGPSSLLAILIGVTALGFGRVFEIAERDR